VPPVTIEPDGVLSLATYLWGQGNAHTADLRRAAGRGVHYREVGRRSDAGGDLAYEHLVPVLILGLRRVVRQEAARQVLRLHRGCLVTKEEHQRLGSMRNDHPDLLIRAVLCPPQEVVDVCLERYT